jgi:hypothetical protein
MSDWFFCHRAKEPTGKRASEPDHAANGAGDRNRNENADRTWVVGCRRQETLQIGVKQEREIQDAQRRSAGDSGRDPTAPECDQAASQYWHQDLKGDVEFRYLPRTRL